MSDNPGEMYKYWTGAEVPLIAPFTEIKDYQTTSKMPRFGVLSSKMMLFVFKLLAGNWLSPSKLPYLHTNYQKKKNKSEKHQ